MAGSIGTRFFSTNLLILHAVLSVSLLAASDRNSFICDGFRECNLHLTDSSVTIATGALRLTNNSESAKGYKGHAFYPRTFQFMNPSSTGKIFSFSTRFVFQIVSNCSQCGCCGLAFTISPSPELPNAAAGNYLGLFNQDNNGQSHNHIFAVEFDTSHGYQENDTDNNHIGVDINSIVSGVSETAAYYINETFKKRIELQSGDRIQSWIDYDGSKKLLSITIAPLTHPLKPNRSLITYNVDLFPVLKESMYVGFSSSTITLQSEHYILAWSFAIDREAPPLDLSRLPSLTEHARKRMASRLLPYSSTLALFLLTVICIGSYALYKNWKLTAERVEEWELKYPHRFSYKELYKATKGFQDKELLGRGGFGSVYKGVLPSTRVEVAVKRASNGSKQGIREFVAEVSSLGRLRHKNLVQLQGWCRHGKDLLLVYDFMVNGSLDTFLFHDQKRVLSWEERFKILKGIASGLLYLHEGCDQVIVHRDIKASNVLLDAEMNGKVGDFGLARLYEDETNTHTTHLAGTLGYIAPELSWTGKATTSSDVFSFGVLLLEVACGRRPIDFARSAGDVVLMDWVDACWKNGMILRAMDPRLGLRYVMEEAELVLKLGVLCSRREPDARPSMMQVVQYLNGDSSIDEYVADKMGALECDLNDDHLILPYPPFEKSSSLSTSFN
ncbi:L-type lectin-domain containing receptor kinase V-9 [Nymphaea thermarum]|nr:L-type lectin-domain containing receptor kinase V-9 [Nymphaea thermarum]